MSFNVLRKSAKASTIPCLLSLLALTGCTMQRSISNPTQPNVTVQNWQIQSGNALTPSGTPPMWSGTLSINGSQATGLFRTVGICMVEQTPPTLQYSGTYDASTRTLVIGSRNGGSGMAPIEFNLNLASTLTTPSTGTFSATGEVCNIAMQGSAIAVEIPALTGTFTGPLTGTANATATLTLAQSTTPNASAAFPLTGTFAFTSGTCSSTLPVSGTIQGVSFNLAATASSSSGLTLSGVDASGGSSLTSIQLAFASDPCNPGSASSYTGTLTQ